MKREEKTSRDRMLAELDSLRQQLVSLEQRLGEPIPAIDISSGQNTVSPASHTTRERYRDILAVVPEALIVVDRAGTISFNNENAEVLFGFNKGELLGESIESLIPERFREVHLRHRHEYQANPSTRPMQERRRLVGRRKDGSEVPLAIGLSFTHLGSGGLNADHFEGDGLAVIAIIAEDTAVEPGIVAESSSFGVLISTKLQAPRLTSDYVSRPRLFRRFDRQGRLTLVSAPAGYGKSTLLSSWLETLDCPVAWLSLDENDDDLASFLSYFIAAIRTIFPEIGGNTLALLNAAEIPPLQIVSANLINELNLIDQAYVVVLDDYHLVQDQRVHDLLARLLLHAPHTLHLVLASRTDPPIPIANLRAKGKVSEIRAYDLRFNQQETAAFIEKLLNTPVDKATAATLEDRSEGWVTGLRLAVLSRHHLLGDGVVPGTLDVDNRFVADYLLASVFSKQTPEVQNWLIQSAILNRFCPELCEAVFSPEHERPSSNLNGRTFLDLARQANLFLIPLDQNYRWFRFHHLFQHFLQTELRKRRTAGEIGELHARASEWLEMSGLLEEAFQHAIDTGDELAPALLIERNRLNLLNEDRWPTIGRWLAKLPAFTVQQRPRLLLAQAWVHYFQFALEAIPPLLQTIESSIQGEPDEISLQAEVDFFWGNHWYWLGNSQESLVRLNEALEHFPVAYHQGRAETQLYFAQARFAMGEKDMVEQELRRTLQSDRLPFSSRSRLLGVLIFTGIMSGETRKALQAAQQLEDAVAPTSNAYLQTWTCYVQAVTYFRGFRLEEAAKCFVQAVDNRYVLHTRAAVDSLAGLALTYQMLGQAEKAEAVMRQLLEFALEQKTPSYASIARSIQARLQLMQGDLESAVRWQETAELAFDVGRMFIWLEVPRLTRCRVLVAQGNSAGLREAVELLTDYLQESQSQHNVLSAIEISILLAVAYKKLGRSGEANQLLERAVVQSWPGGLIQPFVEGGEGLDELLDQLRRQGVAPEFIRQILKALLGILGSKVADSENTLQRSATEMEIFEELTYQERKVLALLGQERSNQEIANSLTVSIHTVKRHTSNIYRKLGAKNRRQAVLKAQTLGILPPS